MRTTLGLGLAAWALLAPLAVRAADDDGSDDSSDPAAMASAHAELVREHGGEDWSLTTVNLAEYQGRDGGAYRWDGEASFGGDLNRLVATSEGEGAGRPGLEAAEIQALYSRAVSPFFNLRAGLRQDFAPGDGRTYATVGFEGLAPYWLQVSVALFVSDRGELLGRLESLYDLRLTQRLIVQPRVELNLAARDSPQTRTGSGLSNAEIGLRLRYEIRRTLAPYVGVSLDRKVGRTADFARQAGEDVGGVALVAGVRTWF